MPRVLLLLGVCLLVAAGITYFVKEQDVTKRRSEAASSDRVLGDLSRSFYRSGISNESVSYDSASKISTDHALTWFLAGAGVLSAVAGLATFGRGNPSA
jgi:hypothetical protein